MPLASDSDILKGSEMTQEAYLGELQDGVQQHRGSGMMRKRAHYRIDDGNFLAGATNDRVVAENRGTGTWRASWNTVIGGRARTVCPNHGEYRWSWAQAQGDRQGQYRGYV